MLKLGANILQVCGLKNGRLKSHVIITSETRCTYQVPPTSVRQRFGMKKCFVCCFQIQILRKFPCWF
jgi:hypothetical protein